jgi:hypothetical protein
VYAVFDRFCDRTLNPDARRHGLAFELARLDRLLEACWPKAVGGDLAAIALAEKLSARRCVMLGLHAPTAAILKIIDESAPRVTSTQQLEATLDALTEDAPVDGQAPNQEWQVCVRHCVVRTGDTGMNGSIGSESELIQAIRERIIALDVTCDSVNEIARLTPRYLPKLLGSPATRRMTITTALAVLGALGLRITLTADETALRRLRAGSQWQSPRLPGPQYRMHSRVRI